MLKKPKHEELLFIGFIDESCDSTREELCEIADCSKPNAKELCPDHCDKSKFLIFACYMDSY